MSLRMECRLCSSVYEISGEPQIDAEIEEKRCNICGIGMTDCTTYPATAFQLIEPADWPELFSLELDDPN